MSRPPRCVVIAGPNGSGKTTFAREFLTDAGVLHFVNADLIAAGLSPLRPDLAAISAGRLFLAEVDRLASAGADFALESTLSGRPYLTRMRKWKARGYRGEMIYLKLASPNLALRRIATRVKQGGHDVPRSDVLRRFSRSWDNFRAVYPAARRRVGTIRQLGGTAPFAGARTMKTRRNASAPSLAARALKALRRAVRRARINARRYGTPVYVWRDGRVVSEKP